MKTLNYCKEKDIKFHTNSLSNSKQHFLVIILLDGFDTIIAAKPD